MAEIIQNISNLLTPLNMLPNSDFLASDTLPIVLDIGQMKGNTVELCKNWVLKGDADGVKVFISSNRITIECTRSEHMYLISNELKLIQGRAYTSIASLVEENCSLNSWELSLPVYARTKYSRKDKEKHVDIFTLENNNSFIYAISLNFCNTTAPKAVSIYDMALYEGSFTNPPVRQSTDSFLSDVIGSQHIEQEITEVRNDIRDVQTHISTVESELHAFELTTDTAIEELGRRKQENLTFDSTPVSSSSNPVTSYGIYTFVNNKISNLQTKLTFDNTPTSGSTNSVRSGGIYSFVNTKISTLQTKLTFDTEPKSGSSNPVTSGGIYTYIDSKISTLQTKLTFDTEPRSGSTNPVTSGGVYSFVESKIPKTHVVYDTAMGDYEWRREWPDGYYLEVIYYYASVESGKEYVKFVEIDETKWWVPVVEITGLKLEEGTTDIFRKVDVDYQVWLMDGGVDFSFTPTFKGRVVIKLSGPIRPRYIIHIK